MGERQGNDRGNNLGKHQGQHLHGHQAEHPCGCGSSSGAATAADPSDGAQTHRPGHEQARHQFTWRSPLAWLLIALIQVYRYAISPMLGPSCRFAPTCSAYALQAVRVHGGVWGSWLALRRISRCHAWNPGGYDPVPPKKR